MQGATKPITEILRGQELHIHRMKQRQPLMRPPSRTKGAPTGYPCHPLMHWISIELLKPLTTAVHGWTTITPFKGCTRASLAIQCKSCTSSASWGSPDSTAASYKTAVRPTTCDQLPASRWTLTASIKASTDVFTDTAIPSTSFLFWLAVRHHLEPWQHRGPRRIQVEVQQHQDDHKDHPNQASIPHALPLLPLACHPAACAFNL